MDNPGMNDPSLEEPGTHEFLGINSFFVTVLIMSVLWIGYMMHVKQWFLIPESGMAMLLGFIVGGAVSLSSDKEAEFMLFNPEIFFFFLLPPIIFNAGYALKRRNFFHNFSSICMFAVMGTAISTAIIGYGLYALASLDLVPLKKETPLECLLFGALLSAVDPVATLAILGSKNIKTPPLLYTLIFGESVLNDAVSIVLFQTFQKMPSSGEFTAPSLMAAVLRFLGVSVGSVAVGAGIALAAAFVFRHVNMKERPHQETAIMMLTAYSAYSLSEAVGLSGIMTLFFCGIFMAHYTYYNLSNESRVSTKVVFESFSMVSETFLFIYMGMTVVLSFKQEFDMLWDFSLIFFSILLIFLSRALNIFPLAALVNLRRSQPIPFKIQIVLWFAGLRGAIAFALALNFPAGDPSASGESRNRPVVVTTTLAMVVFTTMICGGLTDPLLGYLGMKEDEIREHAPLFGQNEGDGAIAAAGASDASDGGTARHHRVPQPGGIHACWKAWDVTYMKPLFGGKGVDNVATTAHGRRSAVDGSCRNGAGGTVRPYSPVDDDHVGHMNGDVQDYDADDTDEMPTPLAASNGEEMKRLV